MKNISVMQLFRNSMDLTSCLYQLTGTRQTIDITQHPCNGIRRNRWPRSVQGEVRRQHEWRVTPSRGRTLRHPDSRNQASAWELVQTQERGYVHQIPKQWSGPAVFSWPGVWTFEAVSEGHLQEPHHRHVHPDRAPRVSPTPGNQSLPKQPPNNLW